METSCLILLGVLFYALGHRHLFALARFIARNAPIRTQPACGDEVKWQVCGYGDCATYYGRIDALNSRKKQFLLKGKTEPKDFEDLVWRRYYQNWYYDEGSKQRLRELEEARSGSGWTRCP